MTNESVDLWFSYSIIYYGAPSGHQAKYCFHVIYILIQITFFDPFMDPLLDWYDVPCQKFKELNLLLSLVGALSLGLK
jgi:hypothetical protein